MIIKISSKENGTNAFRISLNQDPVKLNQSKIQNNIFRILLNQRPVTKF